MIPFTPTEHTTMSRLYDKCTMMDRESSNAVGGFRGGPGAPVHRASFPVLPIRGERIGMAILLAIAMIGISQADSRSAGPVSGYEAPEPAGAGTMIASEVRLIRIPEALAKLAARQARSHDLRVHDDLRRSLEAADQRGLWYAVTIRGHQANGVQRDLSFIRHPHDEPEHFEELAPILARAAGGRGCVGAGRFSNASVQVISDDLIRRGPAWLIARLSRPRRAEVEAGEP